MPAEQPRRRWVGGDSENVGATGGVFDYEQHVQRHCCIQRSAHPRWPYLPTEKPYGKPRCPVCHGFQGACSAALGGGEDAFRLNATDPLEWADRSIQQCHEQWAPGKFVATTGWADRSVRA